MLDQTSADNPPKRWLAVVLDVVFAGMGHAYIGKTRRALLLWLLLWACAALAIVGGVATRSPWSFGLLLPISLNRLVFAIDVAQIPRPAYRSRRWFPVGLDTVICLALSVGLTLFVRAFLIESFKIPAASMTPTLLVGDHIFVNKISHRFRSPERGEVAVFQFPEKPEQDFIKRVVAIGGDRVDVRGERLFINGWEVPRCPVGRTVMPRTDRGSAEQEGQLFVEFLQGHAYLVLFDGDSSDKQGPYVVPDGEYFVMGDNRHQSYDSRMWNEGRGGTVPRALMKGPATMIWASFDRAGQPTFDRLGIRLDRDVVLPSSMAWLGPSLARCLAETPVASATFPPPAPR
jgi:signal peptidase I